MKGEFLVRRTCTVESEKPDERVNRHLEEYRNLPAYVLLGDPGSGKTRAFITEEKESGGKYVRARDIALFEWENGKKVLFIDALDEMRTNEGDGRIPLDHVREHLKRLGYPDFRLSCREADWLGSSDTEALKLIKGEIAVLHLDPLTEENILEILRHKEIPDPNEFLRKAKSHRLEALLRNPQTLNLIVDAASDEAWPESRKQVYEMACRQLVREINPEHRQGNRAKAPSTDKLLEAAGYLSAVQLLSGIAGFSLDEEKSDNQYFCWKELKDDDLPLFDALKTNLFMEDGEERRTPVHRSVAEYLGARYLGMLVENRSLPLGRILALTTGEDGGIVADLRGLAAWFSVHCPIGRRTLIERDPLAVVLYGDVKDFSVTDKMLIFEKLKEEARRYPWFRSGEWFQPSFGLSFGALATQNMIPAFLEMLTKPLRDEADQVLLDCVLDAIQYGQSLPELADPLEITARNNGLQGVIRKDAVRALAHVVPEESARLLSLAEDIRKGIVEDRDDEMLGILLNVLYPGTISPEHVFDYLHPPKQSNLTGMYIMFWIHLLPQRYERKHLPILLDKLSQVLPFKWDIVQEHQLNRMVGGILAEGLEIFGDETDDERLYAWLGVGLDEYGHQRLDGEYSRRIAAWFSDRPERCKGIIELGASICSGSDNVPYCMNQCTMRLYGTSFPADMWEWFLQKAIEHENELSRYFFNQAVHALIQQSGEKELSLSSLAILDSWSAKYPEIRNWLEPYLFCPMEDWRQERAQRQQEREHELQKQKNEWLSYLRKNLDAIRDGSAYPETFHTLALVYRGLFYDVQGNTPEERLSDFLGGDGELIEALHSGFRHVLDRKDLPSVEEIVKLAVDGRIHFILLPCQIGMDELYQNDQSAAMKLEDEKLSILLAFRFSQCVGEDPTWFRALLKKRPALVAKVLIAYALPMLQAGKDYVSGLYQLVHDDAYAEAARVALPELLKGFPLRAKKNQLSNALNELINGGVRYLDRKYLEDLAAGKIGMKSMDAAQTVYWLGLGLLVAPEQYLESLLRYVKRSQVRRGYLASFLYNLGQQRMQLSEAALPRLIELLGPDYSSVRASGSGWVSPAMNNADMVRSFIDTLGGNPSEAISNELEHLISLPKLAGWKNHLLGAMHAQRITRRKASFRRLGVEEITRTLSNLQPSSAADLAALTLELLRDIAKKIRDGNSNDYRQYWSYDKANKKLSKPKPENDCRDALLSDVRERLGKLGIDAQPEGNYAENKRADIRISFGGAHGFNVPIEIKKESHQDIWSAIHGQLIPKYVRDPGTEGHGIYLVFWFGGKDLKIPPDGSRKPRSAKELEERLRQMLSPHEKHHIQVCVIDCALPS